MTRIVWTPRAIEDVRDIRTFIEQDSPQYAQLVAQRIVLVVERLTQFLASGRVVPELTRPDLREVVHEPYRIVYRLLPDAVLFSRFTMPLASFGSIPKHRPLPTPMPLP